MGKTSAERQAKYRIKRQSIIETMPKIPCACGCRQMIAPINKGGKPAKYKHGHNPDGIATRFQKGQKPWNAGTAKPKRKLTHEEKSEICRQTMKKRNMKGTNNPFYGKHYSLETKQLISEKNTGVNNPGWAGGTSTLPYGVGFTRKFKRLIRERDGNKCQRCGKARKQNWRALEVHHIDHNKMNNDPRNLITVCSACNVWLSYHRDESLICFPKRRMLLH